MRFWLILGLAADSLLAQKAKPVTLQNPPPQGRFQLIQLSDMRMDQFLLDTETGRLWQLSSDSKTGVRALVEIQAFLADGTPTAVSAISSKK